MDKSLSVIMPVKNDSARLQKRIESLLEILPELTSNFEICVIDDGSTDSTHEIAQQLTKTFPQVRFKAHTQTRGILAAVRTAVEFTKANNVIVQSQFDPISPTKLKKEWVHRNQILPHLEKITEETPKKKTEEDRLIERLESWCQNLKKHKENSKRPALGSSNQREIEKNNGPTIKRPNLMNRPKSRTHR